MTFFPKVKKWFLPKNILKDSFSEMAFDGIKGNEGVALWLGRRKAGTAEISHLVKLRGAGVIKKPAFLKIEPSLLNELTGIAVDLGVSLIGQIHSHGKGYDTDLSPTDHLYGIRVPFFLSIVAPGYAMRPDTRLEDCGVHIFESKQGYRRLDLFETKQYIEIVPNRKATVLTVGDSNAV